MTRARVLVTLLNRSARLDGPGVLAAIEATGSPRMRDRTRKAWLVPIDRLDDVLAYLQFSMRRTVVMVDASEPLLFGDSAAG